MQTQRTYVSSTDTAKIIRRELKANFPDIKFSVRTDSYSGGSSIRIKWTDGPPTAEVESLVSRYKAGWFDGMTDCYEYDNELVANEDGSLELIHYAPKFVFCTRNMSEGRRRYYWREVERFLGVKVDRAKEHDALPKIAGTDCRMGVDRDGLLFRSDWDNGLLPYSMGQALHMMGVRRWFGESCPGGDPENGEPVNAYCYECGRYQGDHRAPHIH